MWQLDETIAHFASERCRCEVDLSRKVIELSNISLTRNGKQVSLDNTRLLQIETHGNAIEETYVRGDDLIVTIAESDTTPFRTQVYWRALDDEGYFGFEAMVSVQTSLLDVAPELTCKSACGREPVAVDGRTTTVQLPSDAIVYFEFAHASNHDETRVNQHEIAHRLLTGRLEKGVISRARIRGLFLPVAAADGLVTELRSSFEQSAPPLTT